MGLRYLFSRTGGTVFVATPTARRLLRAPALALSLALSACATITGPDIGSEEERLAREQLTREAKLWQESQQRRIAAIGARLLRAAGAAEPVRFIFVARAERDGPIHPDSVNAWTDGSRIWITRGMIRFLRNDDELALVLAHELAHAKRGHMNYLRARQLLGLALGIPAAIFGGQAGAQATALLLEVATKKFDRDQEREADLFGITWMHRAGFDPDVAKDLFRRMAVEIPESMEGGFLSSHPPTAARLLAMERIIAVLREGRDPLTVYGGTAARGGAHPAGR
jgi:predicted Zn-dependent protease